MKKSTIWLIDIDGTVCEDIPNEESYRFHAAMPLPGALEKVKELYTAGDRVTFFTSRTTEHAEQTEYWLDKHGFPYESVFLLKRKKSYRIQNVCVSHQKSLKSVTGTD